jgi:alpha-glucosidase
MSETIDRPDAAATAGLPWWRGGLIYQVYPRSFLDTNGDGIGDLEGIRRKLPYIASLGTDAIWISPFFTSPMKDFGYDVADYRDVDPMFGTLADFDRLVADARGHGIRIMIDLVLSHTSDRHPWFAESRSSRDNRKADWYVWAEPKPDGTPPNNWLSVFGGSGWEWDSRRRQYYLHNFLAAQPDLNFHNPAVQDAVLDVARFWLERGVGGFRLDTVNFYFHDRDLRDNPPKPVMPDGPSGSVPSANPYGRQLHLYDKDRPENLAFLERLRALMDQYPDVAAVGELGTDHDIYALTAAYTEGGRRLHMAYSFDLLSTGISPAHLRRGVATLETGIGSGWPSWALSNHDVIRVASRWKGADPARLPALATALLTSLRGTPCLYQGEELGLTEADVPFELLQDPYGIRFWPDFKGRDGCRTPHPWTADAPNAGFTTGRPWLPVPPEHLALSVASQEPDANSTLNRVRRFMAWRKETPVLLDGSIRFIDGLDSCVIFVREAGNARLLCAFNLGPDAVTVPLAEVSGAPQAEATGFKGSWEPGGLVLPAWDAFFGWI